MKIATKVNSYNVYKSGNKLVGISDEVTIPDFEALTDTISGPGMLGEFDEALLGHFGATEMEIPFKTLDESMFDVMQDGAAVDLTLRISTQAMESSNLSTDFLPSRIVIKGKNKGFTGGSVKSGQGTGSSVKVEIAYILIEVNGKKMFELDKFNFIFKVKDKDLLEKLRGQV